MNIQYPYKNRSLLVKGTFLSPENTCKPPTVTISNEPPLYTLIMLDPDAVGGNLIHWLIVNSGTIILPYLGPHPPPGSGIHHYHFLLIAQDKPITRSIKKRQISIKDLFQKLGLQGTVVDTKFFTSHS